MSSFVLALIDVALYIAVPAGILLTVITILSAVKKKKNVQANLIVLKTVIEDPLPLYHKVEGWRQLGPDLPCDELRGCEQRRAVCDGTFIRLIYGQNYYQCYSSAEEDFVIGRAVNGCGIVIDDIEADKLASIKWDNGFFYLQVNSAEPVVYADNMVVPADTKKELKSGSVIYFSGHTVNVVKIGRII